MTNQRPVELLQRLIRFDTTNPPGNEAGCIGFLDDLLTEAGLHTQTVARTPAQVVALLRYVLEGTLPA